MTDIHEPLAHGPSARAESSRLFDLLGQLKNRTPRKRIKQRKKIAQSAKSIDFTMPPCLRTAGGGVNSTYLMSHFGHIFKTAPISWNKQLGDAKYIPKGIHVRCEVQSIRIVLLDTHRPIFIKRNLAGQRKV